MIDFLNQYLKEINKKIKDGEGWNWKDVLENHRETIKFMQHERLIHLLVTLTVAILFVVSMMFSLIYQFTVLFLIDFSIKIITHCFSSYYLL